MNVKWQYAKMLNDVFIELVNKPYLQAYLHYLC